MSGGITRFTLDCDTEGRRAIFAERTVGGRVWICSAEDISYVRPEKLVYLLNLRSDVYDLVRIVQDGLDGDIKDDLPEWWRRAEAKLAIFQDPPKRPPNEDEMQEAL